MASGLAEHPRTYGLPVDLDLSGERFVTPS